MYPLLCLCHLYVQGAAMYVNPHQPAAPDKYYAFDHNRYANPLAQVQVGYGLEGKRWAVDFYARHESFAGTNRDRGENSAGFAVRWHPFAR